MDSVKSENFGFRFMGDFIIVKDCASSCCEPIGGRGRPRLKERTSDQVEHVLCVIVLMRDENTPHIGLELTFIRF